MQNSEVAQFFKLGTQVEVTSNAYGYRNSWYKATIIPQPKPNNNLSDVAITRRKKNRIWVEYDTILYDQDHSKKFREYSDISLIRPLPPIHNDGNDNNFDKYDYVDAYHENGWFTGVILDVFNEGLKYLVAFLHPYEEFLYEKARLRVHLGWLGGDNWTKWHPSEKVVVAFCAPNVGEIVVGSLLESTPAVVTPAKQAPSTSGNGEGRGSSEPNDAKPPQDAPQKLLQPCPFTPVASSKGSTHCSGKRKASDEQISSSLVFSPNSEGIEKNDDSDSRSPAKLNRVSEVDEPEKLMHEEGDSQSKVPVSHPEPATIECPETCPITICFSRRSDNSQAWPFTKRSNMWKVIESMEVFKKVPQMPHFSPLNELEEISREMIALSTMMKFSYVVERISAGSPDDLNSPTIIQDTLKNLDELEYHGFNITPLRVYVNERVEKIRMEKELKGNLEKVDNEIRKHQDDKAAIERKVNELAKQIRCLHEEIDKKKSAMCLQDLQLASLESQKGIMSSKLDSLVAEKPAFEW